jgi:hypothetical protein
MMNTKINKSLSVAVRSFIGGLKIQDTSKVSLRNSLKYFKIFLAETGLPVTDLNILNNYETWLSENGLKGVPDKISVAKRFMLYMGAEEADVALTGGGVDDDGALNLPFFTASEMNLCHLFSWPDDHNVRNRAMVSLILDAGITFRECAGILPHEIDVHGRQLIVSANDDRYAVFSPKTAMRLQRFSELRPDNIRTFFGIPSANEIQAVWIHMLDILSLPRDKIFTLRQAWANNAFFNGGLSADWIAAYLGINRDVIIGWIGGRPKDYHQKFDGVLWENPQPVRPQNTADKIDGLIGSLL